MQKVRGFRRCHLQQQLDQADIRELVHQLWTNRCLYQGASLLMQSTTVDRIYRERWEPELFFKQVEATRESCADTGRS